MKRFAFSPLFLIIIIQVTISQTPQSFNYQAMARDSEGSPIINQPVAFQICILKGNATGSESYGETHNPTTNEFGLVSLQIGNGTVDYGQFDTINWGSDSYFLKVSLDESGETNFTWMGTTQLLAVPYAIYADSSGKGDNLGNHLAKQNIQTNEYWISKNGNNSGIRIVDSIDYGVRIQSTNSAKALYVVSDNSSDSAIAIYAEHPDGPFGYLGGPGFGIYGDNKVTGNYGYIGGWSYPIAGYNPDHNCYGIIGYNDISVYGHNSNYGTSGRLGSTTGVNGYHSSQTMGFIASENLAVYGSHPSGNNGYIGSDTIGVYGYADAYTSMAIYGENGSGCSGYLGGDYGVVGNSANTSAFLGGIGHAIYGINNISNMRGEIGTAYGVMGKSENHHTWGYLGAQNGVYGVNTTNGNQGYFGGDSIGTYGYAPSLDDWAGYFDGKGYFNNWLGIGIEPQSMLDVQGEGTPNGGVPFYNEVVARFRNDLVDHHTALALDAQDGNDAMLYFSEDGEARWDIRTDVSEDIYFLTDNVLEFRYQKGGANAEVLKLYYDGTHYKIKTYGDLLPSSANYYDCGSSATYWNQVYANYFVDISDKDTYKSTQSLPFGLKEILGIETLMSVTEDGENDFSIDPQSLEDQISGLVVKPEDEEGNIGIRTNELIPVLIKAIQEQQVQIEELKAKINALD